MLAVERPEGKCATIFILIPSSIHDELASFRLRLGVSGQECFLQRWRNVKIENGRGRFEPVNSIYANEGKDIAGRKGGAK